jgi:hypothetical protein
MSKLERIFEAKLKSSLRRMTWSWEPYQTVKNKAKVAPATFECKLCKKWCYTGSSNNTLKTLQQENKEKLISKEVIYIDHIDPVESLESKVSGDLFDRLNVFIRRLFCKEDNLQPLCKACHDEKSLQEKKVRKNTKKVDTV